MGGRGSASGIGSIDRLKKSLPSEKDFSFLHLYEYPLRGDSQKQIDFAQKVRIEILRDLMSDIIHRTSDGRSHDLFDSARKGQNEMWKTVLNDPIVSNKSNQQSARVSAAQRTVDAYKDIASRVKIYNDIIKQYRTAKDWLKNDPAERYEFKRSLKKRLSGKK